MTSTDNNGNYSGCHDAYEDDDVMIIKRRHSEYIERTKTIADDMLDADVSTTTATITKTILALVFIIVVAALPAFYILSTYQQFVTSVSSPVAADLSNSAAILILWMWYAFKLCFVTLTMLVTLILYSDLVFPWVMHTFAHIISYYANQ